ncbi:helix-turn-helix domain-containing protein [Haloferax sp. AB510]|uniref:helix-turn-helix domain-containing protein n=1 Tax=Haloferax sp. AB510 TaxID=2934172 RepID=UPI00209C5936|nr:helix-turn-helix domain-containing protein [Haloferax sp. AB510]MCO8267649.1 helix-turn-helix domain-containing protein [Haloferax sp. AB510]
MSPSIDEIDDISPRDIVILKLRVEHPTASVRALRDILEEEYDISLSHNRVNDILRELSEQNIFQKAVLLNEDFFEHYLFQIAFHYPNFEDRWEECYDDLMNDPHVLMFFNADDYHQWQFIARFRKSENKEEWKRNFFKKHGDLIAQFDSSSLPEVHKFRSDMGVLEHLLTETEEGQKYLDKAALQSADEQTEKDDTKVVLDRGNK